MSKTTNDGLTRSGAGCFIDVPIWQQWTGLNELYDSETAVSDVCDVRCCVCKSAVTGHVAGS